MTPSSNTVNPQNIFGRGRIVKVFPKYAYAQDSREHNIFVPGQAVLTHRCPDLTKKFAIHDEIIFAAKKQCPPRGTSHYIATSIAKNEDLECADGRIVGVGKGCAFGETSAGTKLFIPFTAHNGIDHEWRMNGATKGAKCAFEIMPQVERADCRFVAATIVLDGEKNNETSETTFRAERSELSQGVRHLGVVLPYMDSKCVYSAQTGYTQLSSPLNDKLKLGTWIKYGVCETDDSDFNWMATDVDTWQPPQKVSVDVHEADAIRVDANAIVCRVNQSCAWFWNDFVGRMFQAKTSVAFKPKTVVHLTAKYIAGREMNDTIWEVECVSVAPQEERANCARNLVTSGVWKISSVTHMSEDKFAATLESEIHGLASMLSMDFIDGLTPKRGELCHAAVIRQYLPCKGALPYRVVLAFPVNSRTPTRPTSKSTRNKPVKKQPKLAVSKKAIPPSNGTQNVSESERAERTLNAVGEKGQDTSSLVGILKQILSDDQLFRQIIMRFPQHAQQLAEIMHP